MHLLIVDDDALVRRALERRFRGAGYTPDRGHRVSVAEDDRACLRLCAEVPVDVIFMDGDLGNGASEPSGPSIVRALRSARCTAKIVMTSSRADLEREGIAAGADASCDKTNLGADIAATLAKLGISPP